MNHKIYLSFLEVLIDPKRSVDEKDQAASHLVAASTAQTNRTTISVLGLLASQLVKADAERAGCDTDDMLRRYMGALERNTYEEEVPND